MILSHPWPVFAVFWFNGLSFWVYFETSVKLRELKPSRVLSSNHYCVRATQDSRGVASPQL